MVYSRNCKHVAELGFTYISDYCDLIINGNDKESEALVILITTNLTSFFREKHHFDFLINEGFDKILKIKNELITK